MADTFAIFWGYAAAPMPKHAARCLRQLSTCLLALGCLFACRASDPTVVVPQIELADRFEFAESRALAGQSQAPFARRDGETLVQNPGTSIRFGFAVPEHGSFATTLALEGAANPSSPAVVHVSLFEAGNEETILLEQTLADATAPTPLEADLSPWSGRLVNLELRYASQARSQALRWDRPRINGTAPSLPTARHIQRARYNVLVVLLDSLRADHITPYGSLDVATPHLAQLAAKGVLFESARTNASWTRPSVVTMFSSRYPWSHGVLEPDSVFPKALPYLPELLSEAGYATEGASGNDMVSALFGMSRGFNTLYSLRKSPVYRTSRDPVERARFVWTHLLDEVTARGDTPFFAYLHQLDPHSPYKPAAKYRRRVARTPSSESANPSIENIRHLRQRAGDLSDEQIDYLGWLYKGEVAFMDDYVGEIVRQLEVRDLAKNTLIVFTSDHGEEFFEHESLGHGHTVYDELLRVPLILRLDGVLPAGRRVSQPVELIDLAPTVLDLLGLDIPDTMQGRSLLPYIEDPATAPRTVSLAGSAQPWQFAIGHGRWKLILRKAVPDVAEETFHLFDLERDPKELRDISSEHPIVATALRQLLAWHLDPDHPENRPLSARTKLDPQTLEALKAIGYVGQ